MTDPKSLRMLPWFPRDFQSSTRGWPWHAKAVYRDLLDAQWEMGGLPIDAKKIARTCHIPVKTWLSAWQYCEHKFPITDGFRKNERLEEHRVKALRLYAQHALGARTAHAQRANSTMPTSPSHLHPEVSIDTSVTERVKNPFGKTRAQLADDVYWAKLAADVRRRGEAEAAELDQQYRKEKTNGNR